MKMAVRRASSGILLATVLALVAVLGINAQTCPPRGFDSAPNFNLARYIEAPWYVQQQMPLQYQPVNDLFCVRAVYRPINAANLNRGLNVINTARRGSVTGAAVGSGQGGPNIQAIPAQPRSTSRTAASKLSVGLSFLRIFSGVTFGPYWVVAFDPGYQWAIISGGPPRRASNGKCVAGTPNGQINGAGFWLFSRTPVDPGNTEIMRTVASNLGLDLSVLVPVQHAGCTYPATAAATAAVAADESAAAVAAEEPVAQVAEVAAVEPAADMSVDEAASIVASP